MSEKARADVLVIGSGPAGCRVAMDSARRRPGARVVLVERKRTVGGLCVHAGTIPSKTLREVAISLTGYRRRGYGLDRPAVHVTQTELMARVGHVVDREIAVLRSQMGRLGVELILGEAGFAGPNEVIVRCGNGDESRWEAGAVVIATGTDAVRDPAMPYDGRTVIVPDELFMLSELPRSMTVIGGGIIGCEYAAIYGLLGVPVTLVDARRRLLPTVDGDIWEALAAEMTRNGVTFALGERVAGVERTAGGVVTRFASGRAVESDVVVTASGRAGCIHGLNLDAIGLAADDRGRIAVDQYYRTAVPNVFAVGDIVGFPSLASTAMEQGRIAACSIHSMPDAPDVCALSTDIPYGIYTVPEIATIGPSEEDLRKRNVPYEAGRADWTDIARGHIMGLHTGILKLMWHRDTRKILGVHILGEGATELVHLGQAVMTLGGTVDYFVESVFNYPTLAEAYKLAVRSVAPGRNSAP